MFFLNLTAGEFFAIFGALGGMITALYLLDRSRRKKVVSSLRFWTPAITASEQRSRKRVREPWSLVLQLASLVLLLLAIAQVELGSRARRSRDHVILLDTSSWTAEKISDGLLLDREKEMFRRYLRALAPRDRVMLVRADGLAIPATPFTSDRAQLLRALNESAPSVSALNIEQALAFAQQAQSWSGGERGEIVYIGPKLIADTSTAGEPVPNLRLIPVPADRENCGIRRIGVKRSEEESNGWQATVAVKNYGSKTRRIRLKVQFAGTQFAIRTLTIQPSEEAAAEYSFTTDIAGQFAAELESADALSSDDHAAIELPRNGPVRISVYTNRPDAIRPLLEANHRVTVRFFPPDRYAAHPPADVMILDQMAPPEPPGIASLWIQPPKTGSPLPVKGSISDAVIQSWRSGTALATGLHAKEAHIPVTEVFETFAGDIAVGSIAEGPAVVARPETENRPKIAVIGFNPVEGQLRFEVTTPLLFANLLRWLSPESLRTLDIGAAAAGAATVTLDADERADDIRVIDSTGGSPPFTIRNRTLELFVSRPSIVHITSEGRERVLSLTLPDVAELEWKPATAGLSGIPTPSAFGRNATDLWQILAILSAIGLFAEWMLFGRWRVAILRKSRSGRGKMQKQTTTAERENELVLK